MREFLCHFYYPAKMASTISPQNGGMGRHVPPARSGAQIKNLDPALQWTPSQMVPDGTNVVAIQKFFKQIVLVIHSLYTSHPIYGNVIRKDCVSTWSRRRSGAEDWV